MKRLLVAFVLVGAAVVALTFLQVLPVRAYVEQRREYDQAAARLTLLKKENADLRARARRLKTSAEIERLARQEFGMVRPGEVVYAIPGLVRGGEWSGASTAPTTAPPTTRAAGSPSLWSRVRDTVVFWD